MSPSPARITSLSLAVRPSVRPSVRLFVRDPSVRPSVRRSVRAYVCPSGRPSFHSSVRPFIRPTGVHCSESMNDQNTINGMFHSTSAASLVSLLVKYSTR